MSNLNCYNKQVDKINMFMSGVLSNKKYTWWLLVIILFGLSCQYFFSRPIKVHWTQQEAYLMRFQWLDSVNLYLKTGKILMINETARLEDVSTGEDQGYPFILFLIGAIGNIGEMNFGHFVRFNYLLFISLGVATSILLYMSFKSFVIAVIFYYYYLRFNIYTGGINHHWMMGAYIPFYLSFLTFFVFNRKMNPLWFCFYFLIAGIANIVREGDGTVGILLFIVLIVTILTQESIKKHAHNFRGKLQLLVFFLCAYSIPWLLLSGARVYRNYKYFNGAASNMITHHGLWHNAFIGLSYIPNPYGITWDDTKVLPFVKKVNPRAEYLTNEYFAILRQLYFKILWESPGFFVRNIFAKIVTIHEYLASLFPQNFPIPVPKEAKQYRFYLFLGTMYLSARKNIRLRMIFFLIMATLGVSTLPGLIALPAQGYLVGLYSSYLMTWVLFFAMLYTQGINRIKGTHV